MLAKVFMILKSEIEKRKTFAIISHPDAGKTTITEKLLLFGGAINLAGSVKAKKSKKFATSDWMEIEKQRGISVTSSVMAFSYKDHEINLIDTPGHQDFSEDTYRTLTAVDSSLMLIDAANGVEAQTVKLFKVCQLQQTPTMAFINKLDRPGKDPFDLLKEIEDVLGLGTYPINWPIGMGDEFRGVYDRFNQELIIFANNQNRATKPESYKLALDDPQLEEKLGLELTEKLREDIELLDIAGDKFDFNSYNQAKVAPVFFGSALNSFGVECFLNHFIKLAPSPQIRKTKEREVNPEENKFSGFIFKIQANMDPNHRDRVAFMRICSGEFLRGMKSYHVRLSRFVRLGRPTQFMAKDRSLVDSAYPGDIVGIHDPGIFRIGDTLSSGEVFHYTGIPVFAPEHFFRVQLKDPLKSKQLKKGLNQLSEEGAIQIFRPLNSSDQYVGVVGVLQIDVVKYRIKAEYGVNVVMLDLPYNAARWVTAKDEKYLKKFVDSHKNIICLDSKENPTILLDHEWRLKFYRERNTELEFHQTCEQN
jgi:peptide chain release factor 3